MSRMANEYLAVVVGGAIAGSEAVLQLREKGIKVVCIEQNPLPFGKIEDGLPRWHVEQRQKEYEKISEKLNHPNVFFVPNTKLGKDLQFDEIRNEWNPSAILLASGAWKDRPLGIPGIDDYIDKGLVYQNPFVYWFNHYHEPRYSGARYDVPDNAAVIGGGLASLDVLKICQIEIVRKALKVRGFDIDMLTIEKEGVPKALSQHGLKWEDLGLKGTTMYYRRRIQDMPLAEVPAESTPDQQAKFAALRSKILNNYRTKYLFQVKECHLPQEPIVDNGRLVGLRFIQTKIENAKVISLPNSEVEYRHALVISSIGSIPDLIPGIPTKRETYDLKDLATGEINGMERLYALGNAVTGKGNIRVSLMHGRQVAQHAAGQLVSNPAWAISSEKQSKVLSRVQELQKKAGYEGDFKTWVERQFATR
jgi:ferredoxin/flavodoxin---NADP+ reductase